MPSQVVAVRVAAPGTHEQHITDFKLASGEVLPKESMIAFIQIVPDTFYTDAAGKKATLTIEESVNGNLYVKTEADHTTANNLLSLPRF